MTLEQVKLYRDAYKKPATRPDGLNGTRGEYIRLCLDGSMDFVTTTDMLLWDDANKLVTVICDNDDPFSQYDFPIKIITASYDIIFEIESIMSHTNFLEFLEEGPLASITNDEQKKYIKEQIEVWHNQALQPMEPEPFYDPKKEPIRIGMPAAVKPREVRKLKVTFDLNGGEGDVPKDVTDLEVGGQVDLTSYMEGITRKNAVLVGWSKTKQPVAVKKPLGVYKDLFCNIGQSTTLYAVWALDSDGDGIADYEQVYTITFDLNAIEGEAYGVAKELKVKLYDITHDLRYTIPQHTDVEDKGVVFLGWTTKATEKIYDLNDIKEVAALNFVEVPPRQDMTVYAAWGYDANHNNVYDAYDPHVTVMLSSTNGEYIDESDPMLAGNTYTVPGIEEAPVLENLVCVGWSMTSIPGYFDGEPDIPYYKPGQVINVEESIILYPVYCLDSDGDGEPNYSQTETVTFNSKYGDIPNSVEFPYGSKVSINQTMPNAEDENGTTVLFLGWTADSTYNEKVLTNDDDPSIAITFVKECTTTMPLYAVWAEDVNKNNIPDYKEDKIPVVFYDDGKSGTVPANMSVFGKKTATLPTDPEGMEKYCALFAGWSLSEQKTINTTEEKEAVQASLVTTVSADDAVDGKVTVYPVWYGDDNDDGQANYLDSWVIIWNYVDLKGDVDYDKEADIGVTYGQYFNADEVKCRHGDEDYHGITSKVLFLGWSSTYPEKIIFGPGDTEEFSHLNFIHEITVKSGTPENKSGDVEVFAVYAYDTNDNGTADVEEECKTLTFEYINDGIEVPIVGDIPSPITVPTGTSVDLPTPDATREGYILGGWTTQAEGGGDIDSQFGLPLADDPYTVTEDTTLYFFWVEDIELDLGDLFSNEDAGDDESLSPKLEAEAESPHPEEAEDPAEVADAAPEE